MWDRLDGDFDLLVVGGGINGAGIARDAAHRGLKVAAVEMKDLAFGTSSRSSKLVHGGLRYLEQLEFSLVFESVSERRILLDIAPHMVNPLGFVFPVYKGDKHSMLAVGAGMWLYEGLSLFRSPKRHKKLGKEELEELEPTLRTEDLKGAPLYYDCSTDDARLTLESALDAVRAGAVVATYAKVTDFIFEDDKIVGVSVTDELSGATKDVRARAVVNATGPWTDRTVGMSKAIEKSELLRPTKGVHIVVDREKLPVNNAVLCNHPDDGRALFAIPWGDRTYIGTTDTDEDVDPALVHATLDDVKYLMKAVAHYFPDNALTYADVIATWAGLRPLMAPAGDSKDISASAVSREHQIVIGQDGLITIAGGKLTTYRKMSKEVVDTAVKMLRLMGHVPEKLLDAHTDHEPLPGAVGWPDDDDHQRVADRVFDVGDGHIERDTARLLADTYGMRGIDVARMVREEPELSKPIIEGRPEIVAQIVWGARVELAAAVSDIMVRRTQLFYRDHNQGLEAVERVADVLQDTLNWSDEERQQSIDAYHEDVALSRRWRDAIQPSEELPAEASA